MAELIKQKSLQVINFSTRDFQACIDINNLVKVISLPQLNITPEGPDYNIGLMNMAGTIIPVIDLCMRLNASKPKQYSIYQPILICKDKQNQFFGLIVDKVEGITTVLPGMLQKNVNNTSESTFVSGMIILEGGISLLINVENMLNEKVV
jgi:purine-binding chemotaxis protein CheW